MPWLWILTLVQSCFLHIFVCSCARALMLLQKHSSVATVLIFLPDFWSNACRKIDYLNIYVYMKKKLKQPQTLEVLSQIAVLELTIFFLSVLTFSKIGQVGVLKKEQLPFFEEVKQTKTHKLKSEVDWPVFRRASITETHLDGLWLFLVFQGDCWHGFSFGTSVWL